MSSSNESKGKKNSADKRFEREEMGELIKLFSSLGITVAVGILGFFVLGLWLDRKLVGMGYATGGMGRIVCLLAGLGLTLYWAYLRIVKHLRKFGPDAKPGRDDEEK